MTDDDLRHSSGQRHERDHGRDRGHVHGRGSGRRQRLQPDGLVERDPAPIVRQQRAPWPRPDADILQALSDARIVDCKLVPWGSNYTFAVSLHHPDRPDFTGIYKPGRGEIPLWDFDAGTLYRREYASYLLSCLLDWRFIPPTVIRDGPHGIGTVQLYVEPDSGLRDRAMHAAYPDELRRVFLFDLVTNNADRKSSHCFIGRHDRLLWGIDHGLTFHVQPKLRTVLWEFCDEPIEPELIEAIEALEVEAKQVRALLKPYLAAGEVEMLFARMRKLRETQVFPTLNPRRNIPYGW